MGQAKWIAARIALMYFLVGLLWIFLSDYVSIHLAKENLGLYIYSQRFKGWFFILITGVVLYFLVHKTTREITLANERLRKKEVQLESRNQHYHSLIEQNPDAVIELSLNGQVIYVNGEAEKLLESSMDRLKSVSFSQYLEKNELNLLKGHHSQTLKGVPSTFETTIHLGDRSKLVRCSFVPIIINDEVTGMFAIARDITRERKNEEMALASEKLSVIGQLAAAVAHEIRNPLTSLKGFIQLLKTSNEVQSSYLDIMHQEVDRIDLISGEMLILGKQQDIPFRPHRIDQLLSHVLVLMEAQAHMDNVSMTFRNKGSEDMLVMGEGNQLKQVFINIIKNGVESIPENRNGHVCITLGSSDDHAFIYVEDNGTGMDPERVERLGEPFYSTKEKGTGLGLAVCQKIIQRHKGSLTFKTEKDVGTTVEIRLPLWKGSTCADAEERNVT